ncbi:MAG TPA: FtsW/RodA/SpoVE family cell cycle protein, partial [Verrucomicrobiae bacterium]|nr:FtsW/RodA/SpoVE family cell cycle protein [Verrucomicrobiae bacterium]
MFKRPVSNLTLFLFPVLIMWLGLGILYLMGKGIEQFVWQASLFTLSVLAYAILNTLLGYKGDRFLMPCVLCLTSIGLILLARINPNLAARQFWWATFGVGVAGAGFWGLRDYRRLTRYQYIWAAVALALLSITLLFGATSGGATSWFRIGGVGVEPEELVKLTMIIFLANYLRNNRELLAVGTIQVWRFSIPEPRVLGPLALMVGLSLLILAAQKSLGTALVFYGVALFMVFMATERSAYLL